MKNKNALRPAMLSNKTLWENGKINTSLATAHKWKRKYYLAIILFVFAIIIYIVLLGRIIWLDKVSPAPLPYTETPTDLPPSAESFCPLCWAIEEDPANTLGLYFINWRNYCPFPIVPFEEGQQVKRTFANFSSMGSKGCSSLFAYHIFDDQLEGTLYLNEHSYPNPALLEEDLRPVCPACQELVNAMHPTTDVLLVDTLARQVYDPWRMEPISSLRHYTIEVETNWPRGMLLLRVTDHAAIPPDQPPQG